MTQPFGKCPVCGGELAQKEVEKLLRGGDDVAVIKVRADVCLGCGERLYDAETIRRFEEIREKLASNETSVFLELGRSFQVKHAG